MAATNKSLAEMNKSRDVVRATKDANEKDGAISTPGLGKREIKLKIVTYITSIVLPTG